MVATDMLHNALGWTFRQMQQYKTKEQLQAISTPFFGQSKLDFSPLITTIIKKWECGKLSAEG